MNLAPMPIVDEQSSRTAQVAVLVDGENIPHCHAKAIMKQAQQQGNPRIRRVYGNVTKMPGWEVESWFDTIHTNSGKNSADIRLCIDAVDMALHDRAESFLIVSSDSDFSHIASYLRECGYLVTGMGLTNAGETFQRACGWFVFLKQAPKEKPALSSLEIQVSELIEKEGDNGVMKIAVLGTQMNVLHDIKLSDIPEKNWTKFLERRPSLFVCDAKGSGACVRLKRNT